MLLFDTFKDTIFLKESSELQKQYQELIKLSKEYPNNENIKEKIYIVKKGLDGENEIKYQLEKSNIGLYVLHDINIEYENLKAQIDYVIITKAYCYFIECKNLNGNITIDEKGDFIKEYTYKNEKKKIGMYSPLRQVEAQRDVYKKIWNNKLNKNKLLNNIIRFISEKNFTDTYRVLVVVANKETILNTKNAPKEIKEKVLRSDSLVRKIEEDIKNSNKDMWSNKKEMETWANSFLNSNKKIDTDYYNLYKNKYCNKIINKQEIKEELINFRKTRSKEMNIPAYYVFTNEELDKIIEILPQTIEELKKAQIISDIKIKTHGELIIKEINKLTTDNLHS